MFKSFLKGVAVEILNAALDGAKTGNNQKSRFYCSVKNRYYDNLENTLDDLDLDSSTIIRLNYLSDIICNQLKLFSESSGAIYDAYDLANDGVIPYYIFSLVVFVVEADESDSNASMSDIINMSVAYVCARISSVYIDGIDGYNMDDVQDNLDEILDFSHEVFRKGISHLDTTNEVGRIAIDEFSYFLSSNNVNDGPKKLYQYLKDD